MTPSVAERAKAFGGRVSRSGSNKSAVMRMENNEDVPSPPRSYSKRETTPVEEGTKAGHVSSKSAVWSRSKSFETPPRGAGAKVTIATSPNGVDDIDNVTTEQGSIKEHETHRDSGMEREIEEARQGIAQLRQQVEQMRTEIDVVRKNRKDHISRSREEFKALVATLKEVETLRSENSRMMDEIQKMELASQGGC